ncbi:IncI1 plasmid conjugative transfer integral membrane protein TraY [plant metagenome]|uniref:IncI1 plasmid conjugative transfer integral membrane protein TraY n=1 Tax=plant metagenome TaxID=1297885 RepID=A0A484U2E3_9ZZZZ
MNGKKWLGILVLDVLLPWRPVIKSAKLLGDQARMTAQATARLKEMAREARASLQAQTDTAGDRDFAEVLGSEVAWPLEVLQRNFLLRKRLALGLGGLLLIMAAVGFLVSANRGDLAGMALATMSAGACGVAAFLLALAAHFRLWQLRTRRLSRAERGGFEDFKREVRDWPLQALSPEISISRGMLQVLMAVPLIGSLILVGTAWAQGMSLGEISAAAKSTTDLSRQALIGIFGQVVNDPLASGAGGGGDTILARIFQIGNSALLTVALVIGGWMAFKKVTSAAHDGTVFEQGRGLVHAPIRMLIAISSLAPTANGWSISQLLMLWGASIMGVGTANLATRAATDALSNGQTMVVQPVMSSTVELARGLFQANLCMYAVNEGLDQSQSEGGWVLPSHYVQPKDTAIGMVFQSSTYVCGGADVVSALDNAAPVKSTTGWFSADIDVSDIKKAHLDALRAMQNALYPSAKDFANKVVAKSTNSGVQLPNAEVAILSAAQRYEETVTARASTKNSQIAGLSAHISDSLQKQGWWALGSWYQTFAQANTKINDAMSAKAKVFGESLIGDRAIDDVYQKVMVAYLAQQLQGAVNSGSAESQTNAMQGASASEAEKIIGSVFSAPGQRAVLWFTKLYEEENGQVNPLIGMKNTGDYLLGLSSSALASIVAIRVTVAMATKSVAGKAVDLITGIGKGVDTGLDVLEPYLRTLVIAIFGIGIVLSVYLPMVPFVVWFGGVINWLVVVGEAIIAAPLWAMTHMNGEGDGMGHRSGHGYIFLLNVMVRPFLMVIGFFLAGAGIIAGGSFLNKTFGIGMANAQFDSMTGIMSMLGYLVLYCSLCVNLTHRSFNLILIVPDQVINWVGGHAASALGRDTNDEAHRAINVLSQHLMPRYPGHRGSKGNPAKNLEGPGIKQ